MTSTRPALHDFPDQFESERLLIRTPKPGDGEKLNEGVIESLDELKPWTPWAQEEPSIEFSEEHCRKAYAKFIAREDLALLLFCKKSGDFIGASGLHRFDWSIPRFEIGYWCRSSQTGKGYISEAVARITRFAFEDLLANRVEIHADSENSKSWKIPERLGFQLEGELRNFSRTPTGELAAKRVYAILSLSELKAQ